ncbi:MAG: FtsX-like permease family protein [Acetatifactor sp.]|nr:FtsX-like permease family protein [Acetatifactor sp.]
MVKSQLRKSTFREIKSSMGRFLSIMAIIGLGVGFFAGLKIARQAMVETVEGYLAEHAFYDYRILSTLGFEQESVDYLQMQEDVAAAEGALSFDALYYVDAFQGETEQRQGVLKFHSLTEQLNTVKLTAGRMPETAYECVVDNNLFAEDVLGSKLVLAQENEEETLEHFTSGEYTVVGLVQSPLYLQYERGNTSLGSGRLSGFAYLPRDGFAEDYYTEIYVSFEEGYGLYSDEYEEYLEQTEDTWESYGRQAADLRYGTIVADAEEELADARKEFEDQKSEGENELADAAAALKDAEAELLDGEKQLADAREELEDGWNTLREKKKQLADARSEVTQKETELADGEEKFLEGIDSWNASKSTLEASRNSLNIQKKALNEQKAQLAEQKVPLEEGLAGIAQLEEGLAAVEGRIAQVEAALAQASPEQKKALEDAKTELEERKAELQAQLTALEPMRQQLQQGLQEVAAGEARIAAYESQLASADAQLSSGSRELENAWAEIESNRKELEEGRRAIADAWVEIEDGEQAIKDAEAELLEAEDTIREKEVELADGWAEYEDGLKEYQDAEAEFDEKIADAEEELRNAEQELADLEPPDIYLLSRNTNVGYVCFENDSSIVEGIALVFPVFFVLVAALVCITTMNRMVEEQRTQIGVLKAIGYGESNVMSKYLTYSGLAAVIGCVVGFLLGTWVFPRVIWAAYGIMYKAEALVYVFDWRLAVIALVVSLLCSMGTTWLSCRVELTQVAAQLMRPKSPKAGKRVFLEYIPFLWNRLSFLRKVSLRNIFRYKKRLFMMILGISGCTALLVTGFGIKDSIADIAAKQFEEIQVFDLAVAFKDPVPGVSTAEMDGLKEQGIDTYLCVMEKNMDLITEKGIKSIYLIVGDAQQMPTFVDFHTERGEDISYPGPGEGIISNKLADEYGVQVGDTITLRDEEMRELKLRITAIQQNYIYNYVHISEAAWVEQMGEESQRKTAYVNVQTGVDVHETAAALMKLDNVSNVTVNQDTMERVGSMMASLNIIVVAVILSAAGLAFIVLYNLTNINITERIREIATIKVLGFYKKETESYVFRENLILSVLGMALGLVLGKLLHSYVMSQIQIDMITFDIHVQPLSYVYSGLLTIGFAWFVGKTMGGKLDNISMTESLKSVD